jgi:hypothetical protein
MIADGTIVDADINASAAIALSKLATDPLARANHTGSQTASTISDFNEAAQDAVGGILGTGLSYNDAGNGIGINNAALTTALLDGVSGSSYGLIGTSTYLDVVNTNGYNKEIELDIVSVEAKLVTDGFAKLAAPAFTGTATAVNLTISGDLTVNGTTTNINSTSLVVEDKNVILGDVATPSDITADGGGITLKGLTDKTLNWVDATDSWTSSEHINLASGKSYSMNGTALKDVSETLTNKTLTSPVISSISNTGTLTLPTSTDTLVGRATTDTLTNKTLGSAVATTAFTLNATAELRLADTDSSHYVGFKSPATVTTNKVWILPSADGTAGQVLSTDGSATLSWATASGGGGGASFSEFMLIGA